MAETPVRMSRLRGWLGVVAVGGAMAAAVGPMNPLRSVLGSPTVDAFGTQWFYWFAAEVGHGRRSAGFTDLLFFPWGKDLFAHTGGNLLDAFLAVPLRALFGPVLGFNLWIFGVLASNAWAGARLAGAFGVAAGRRWPAAVLLVLNPYVLGELDFGRPTQAWLAPSALCLATLIGMETAGVAVLAGAWMALAAYGYWYYGLVLGGVALLHGGWRVVCGPRRGRAFALHALAAGVTLAGVLPVAHPLMDAVQSGEVPGLLSLDGVGVLAPLALRTVEGDAQGLYVLAPLAATTGSLLDESPLLDGGGLRFVPGVGAVSTAHFGLFVLGIVGLLGREANGGGWRRWGWLLPALIGALLVASGPAIVIGERLTPNRLYLAAIAHVDVLRRWWWPGRAVLVVHLLVAPAAALLFAQPTSTRMGWLRWTLAVVLCVGLVGALRQDRLLPIGHWDAEIPPTLTCLARAPAGALIDLPLLVDQRNLWFQTVHEKPILGGMLLKKSTFVPNEVAALRVGNTLLRDLLTLGERQYTHDAGPADPAARAALLDLGYRYVLARVDAFQHPRGGAPEGVSDWSRARRLLMGVLGPPVAEDSALALWTLDGAPACP